MTKLQDFYTMNMDRLQPHVQRAMNLESWPGDWEVAKLIFLQCSVSLYRLQAEPYRYMVRVVGVVFGRGIGEAMDEDVITALFRAYLLFHYYTTEDEIGD